MPLDKTQEGHYILEIPIGSTGKIKVFVDPSSGIDPGEAQRLIQRKTITKAQAEDFVYVEDFASSGGPVTFYDLGQQNIGTQEAPVWQTNPYTHEGQIIFNPSNPSDF